MSRGWVRSLTWVAIFSAGALTGAMTAWSRSPAPIDTTVMSAPLRTPPSDAPTTAVPLDGLSSDLEQRLYVRLGSVVHAAVAEALARHLQKASAPAAGKGADAASLTESQRQAFEQLRSRLAAHAISWNQLAAESEQLQLPPTWRDKLFGQAAEMLTRGELTPEQFLDRR